MHHVADEIINRAHLLPLGFMLLRDVGGVLIVIVYTSAFFSCISLICN